ncbi:MAG TPA: oligosaccharide flippase family protein [Allosphingosinicella sp.]|nr:oligosaccharide flippase family protein [Allosphingosinicella sp.]
MPTAEPTPRATLYRSAMLAVAMQWSLRFIGLVSVFILARLLAPEDFGIIGLAVAALALVELLGAIGLRQALLRINAPVREHLDTAWTIQLIIFGVMGAATLASAPFVANFYGQPALGPVLAVLSLRFFTLGVTNIGIIEFDRNLEFGRDLRMRIGSRLAAFAATVTAAFLLQNYWALVVGLVCQQAFFAAASYLAHPFRPRLSLSRRAELLGTSLWIFVNALAQTVQMQIERLVLGRFASAHLVGLYSVSKDLSEIFTQEISTALNRVTFVTVARTGQPLSDAPLRTAQILGAYAMIAAPMGFGLAATAENSIHVLLGSRWLDAAPFLQVVAIYSGLYAVYKVITSSLQASGHARRAAFMSGGGAVCLTFLVAGAALIRPDAIAIAWAAFAANSLILLAGIAVLARASAQPALALALHVFRPFAAGAAMAAAVRMFGPDSGSTLVDLAGQIGIGVLAYPAFLIALWWASGRPAGGETEALAFIGEIRARMHARRAAAESV